MPASAGYVRPLGWTLSAARLGRGPKQNHALIGG
jgi:hypothetical protein